MVIPRGGQPVLSQPVPSGQNGRQELGKRRHVLRGGLPDEPDKGDLDGRVQSCSLVLVRPDQGIVLTLQHLL